MRVSLLALSFVVACGETTTAPATPNDAPRTSTNPTPANPSPAVDAPTELGGMRLGMTAEAFSSACHAKGAKDIPNERAQTILCTIPPEPLHAFDGVVVGTFCGPATTVCELAYVVYGKPAERDDQIRVLVDDLVRRYGPATTAEGPADAGRECAERKSAVHFTRSWSLGRGRIRLAFDCSDVTLSIAK
jgi:hypothetical protein